MLYLSVLLLHLLSVMILFGSSIATDTLLSAARRDPMSRGAMLGHVKGRMRMVETGAGVLALILGISLLFVNPAGMALFKTGMWIHLKTTTGILGILLLLASHAGIKAEGAARWVQPVRGSGQLLIVLTVVAVKLLRVMA